MNKAVTVLRALYALTVGNTAYEKSVTVRGRKVRLQNRGEGAHMGRFGGGWDREVGLQLGSAGFAGTIIVNLWKGSLRIYPRSAS